MVEKPKVYLDATIPSYYCDKRESIRESTDFTRKWWESERHAYDILISDYTIAELDQGNYPYKDEVLSLVKDIPILPENAEIDKIARHYILDKVMPQQFAGDAHHLACASLYQFDFLLTWNCNHLANANKFNHIRKVNNGLGLESPFIVTPPQLVKEK